MVEEEKELKANQLEDEWVLGPRFIIVAITVELIQIDQWSFDSMWKWIIAVSKTGDFDVSEFTMDLMAIAPAVSNANRKVMSGEEAA